MFEVYTCTAYFRSVLITFPTEAEAVTYLENYGAVCIEADEDHPGCYDAFDPRLSRVISIQPAE
jgi:hypothetical protein